MRDLVNRHYGALALAFASDCSGRAMDYVRVVAALAA